MFKSISEFRKFNKQSGYHFFSRGTMRFFASRVESGLYKNQTFITSEKRCFEDYRRVYSVRLARPNGTVNTLFKDISTLEAARKLAKEYE